MKRSVASAGRRTNLALLALVPAAVLTGLFSNTIGVDWPIDPAVIHGMVALAIVVLVPWKTQIAVRGARKQRPSRWNSYVLTTLVFVTIGTGLVHSYGSIDRVGPLTVMQVHVGGALLTLVAAAFHVRSHPVLPRRTDLDRRAAVRSLALGAGAAAVWIGWEGSLDAMDAPGEDRRFTGSHEIASFEPNAFPVVSWLDDRVQRIDRSAWRVHVDGRPVSLDDLASMQTAEVTAIIDCTGGWYSEQRWRGVPLSQLVDATGARSIEVRSATGYARRFPVRDLDMLLLATHVGDEELTAGHGFPARLVAPGRRGFWWVKWVVSIETSRTPWWLQLPFPAT